MDEWLHRWMARNICTDKGPDIRIRRSTKVKFPRNTKADVVLGDLGPRRAADSASEAEQVDNVFGSTNYQYLNKQTKDFSPVDIAIQLVSNAT